MQRKIISAPAATSDSSGAVGQGITDPWCPTSGPQMHTPTKRELHTKHEPTVANMSDLHLSTPHTKTLTIKHLEVAEAQWSWNPRITRMKILYFHPKNLFFPVFKAKNNPSSFLFTGQTEIHVYGKTYTPIVFWFKKLESTWQVSKSFF